MAIKKIDELLQELVYFLSNGSDFSQLNNRLGYHLFQDHLKSHGVAAAPTGSEEGTVAVPLSILEMNVMGIVFTLEGNHERFEMDAIALHCIALRFVNLSDHPIIHFHFSFRIEMKKRHAPMACLRNLVECRIWFRMKPLASFSPVVFSISRVG